MSNLILLFRYDLTGAHRLPEAVSIVRDNEIGAYVIAVVHWQVGEKHERVPNISCAELAAELQASRSNIAVLFFGKCRIVDTSSVRGGNTGKN